MSTPSRWDAWLQGALEALDGERLRRHRVPLEPIDAVRVRLDGAVLTLFSGNDYLGLSHHPAVRQALVEAAEAHGMGPRGSALICGYTEAHHELEVALAALKGCEAAVLTPTGFSANLALLGALGGEDVAIFSDALNHASIVDGCRLAARSGAKVHVYRHGDADHLDALLGACERSKRIIVTDGLFSMDGDIAPLEALVALKARHEALLMVDDAHGSLVFGAAGGGVAEALGVSQQVDLHVGTLSKAFGAQGGFIASSRAFCDWLVNRGRAQIYSTALPLPVVAAAKRAIEVTRDEPEHRERLWRHIQGLAAALHTSGESPIFSRVFGDPESALEASRALLKAGFHVTAIRPPTVPVGTSRLRVTLSAAHSEADVSAICEALAALAPQ